MSVPISCSAGDSILQLLYLRVKQANKKMDEKYGGPERNTREWENGDRWLTFSLKMDYFQVLEAFGGKAATTAAAQTHACFQWNSHTEPFIHQTKGSGVKRATGNFAHNIFPRRQQPHKHD